MDGTFKSHLPQVFILNHRRVKHLAARREHHQMPVDFDDFGAFLGNYGSRNSICCKVCRFDERR